MGNNPTRNALKRLELQDQLAADEYKARAIWGLWRGLKHEIRDRYFNADEIAWINRYGSRLDQLTCMAVEPRNAREKPFLGACLRHHASTSDRERLWLRAQVVVRFEGALERSARCGKAEEAAAVLAARCRQLEADLKDCERLHTEAMPQVWMLQAEAALAREEAARATRGLPFAMLIACPGGCLRAVNAMRCTFTSWLKPREGLASSLGHEQSHLVRHRVHRGRQDHRPDLHRHGTRGRCHLLRRVRRMRPESSE